MAGPTRQYDFTTTFEQSATPSPGTPSVSSDTITLGYADDNYTPKASHGQLATSLANLRSFDSSETARVDNQTVLVSDLDVFYRWDSSSTGTDDGDLIIKPDDKTGGQPGRWLKRTGIGGGGGGGAGSQISTLTAGENISEGDYVYKHEKDFIEITASNKFADLNEGSGDLVVTLTEGVYLMDTDENILEFTDMVAAAFDTAGTLDPYTVSFSQSTRKFTISNGSNFSIKWKTGAHGSDNLDDHFGTIMGYDDSADDTSATSFEADNAVDTTVSTKFFWMRCDADFESKSKAFFGVSSAAVSKYATATINTNSVKDSYTNGDLGETAILGAHITITASSNDALDFNRSAVDYNATITAGNYYAPYEDLCTEIETRMNALDANSYICTWSRDSDKFTISGATAFVLEFGTGANTATSIDTTLGYTDGVDTSSGTSHLANNAIGKLGKSGFSDDSNITPVSVSSGCAIDATDRYITRSPNDNYLAALSGEGEWLADPSSLEKDFGFDGMLGNIHVNSNGYGALIWLDFTGDATAVYRFRYKNGHGSAWIDSTTTIPIVNGGAANWVSDPWQNAGYHMPHIKVDENNKAVATMVRWDDTNSKYWPYAYYSNDLDTWTKSTGPGSDSSLAPNVTDSHFAMDIDIREQKCAIVITSNGGTKSTLSISDDSGSGYTSFANTDFTGATYLKGQNFMVQIQYFPAETGVNKYRIVAFGSESVTQKAFITYFKGDGSARTDISAASVLVDSSPVRILGLKRDRAGVGNRIVGTGYISALAPIYFFVTNEDYNGGTLTTNNFTSADINPTAQVAEQYHAWAAQDGSYFIHNSDNRVIVIGNAAYAVYNLNDGQETHLKYWTNVTSNTGGSIQLYNGGATDRTFEWVMDYLPSTNQLIICYKASDAPANNLTKGQIFAGKINLAADGTPTLDSTFGFQQIDGGEALAGFQGFLTLSASNKSVTAAWEQFDGVRDVVWTNRAL